MRWFVLWFWLLALAAAARPEPSLAQLRLRAASLKLEKAESYLKSAAASRKIFNQQGGAVELPAQLSTVILPDLHAQRDYLLAALEMPLQGSTVLALLQQGRVNLLCLGDGMHAEQRAQGRWLQAEQDFLQGVPSPALQAEMVESLGLLKMVMDLKVAYPKNFYFVRGNHEDMDPLSPYAKFTRVGESNLVKNWVSTRMGGDFLRQWHACEQSMPLLARGGSFVASHASPEAPITLQEVQQRSPRAFRACCWSDNTRWAPGGSEEQAFLENCRRFQVSSTRPWLVGHRKVIDSLFRSQCGGRLIQINPLDSQARVVAIAPPAGKPFEPQRNVLKLGRIP
ncbi:metallophosphoesterase [bacterium]|nr:metallophosphoesterase [bacterium]